MMAEIRSDASLRGKIRAFYGRIDVPLKLDITTGDVITPRQVEFDYPLMFDGGTVEVLSYPLVTVLAEKLETVIRRGSGNTRGRDFYDIYVFVRAKRDLIDVNLLKQAFDATVARRGSTEIIVDYSTRLEEVRISDAMAKVWNNYVKDTPYAEGIEFNEVIDATLELANMVLK